MTKSVDRLGISLNARQVDILRARSSELGISQTRIIAACIDVLDLYELESILARYEPIRREDLRAKHVSKQ